MAPAPDNPYMSLNMSLTQFLEAPQSPLEPQWDQKFIGKDPQYRNQYIQELTPASEVPTLPVTLITQKTVN